MQADARRSCGTGVGQKAKNALESGIGMKGRAGHHHGRAAAENSRPIGGGVPA